MSFTAEQRKLKEQGLKRCYGPCNKIKNRDTDFYKIKYFLKNGTPSTYPMSLCKACSGIGRNEYQRDWRRMNNVLNGTVQNPRGPNKIYRTTKKTLVDATPFLEWAKANTHKLTNSEKREMHRLRNGKGKVDINFVDQILTRKGHPDQLYVMYPEQRINSG